MCSFIPPARGCAFEVSINVSPAGGLWATPVARGRPGRSSTITCCFHISASLSATARASPPVVPRAGKVTDRRPDVRTEEGRPVRLEHYRPPHWLVEAVQLDVSLHATETQVRAPLMLRPNGSGAPAPLVLDGDALNLQSLKLDRVALPPDQFTATPNRLTITQPPQRRFRLDIDTAIAPSANPLLSGLYRSGPVY